jgi:hypothetical protein
MKCYVRSAKLKILLLSCFLALLLDSTMVVSKLDLRKEAHDIKFEAKNNFENYEITKKLTEIIPNKTETTPTKQEETINLEPIKQNYAVLIALISICVGFLMASFFLIFAMFYNKETLSQISSASIQIVKSLNEIHKGKVTSGDVLTMHI